MTDAQIEWLTTEAYERLQEEFRRRQEVTRTELATKIQKAREEGDLRENAGYHAAREDAAHNESRIKELEHKLKTSKVYMTQEAFDGLQAELQQRSQETGPALEAQIQQALADGDTAAVPDLRAAASDNQARIALIEDIAKIAHIGAPPGAAEGKVTHGSIVTFDFLGDEETVILASHEEERHTEYEVCTPQSPMGMALMGAAEGETVTYAGPTGKEFSLKVLRIEH